MKNFRLRLQILLMAMVLPLVMSAQNVRYVKTNGDNTNDGTSWATAKKDIQDAINDLVNNNMTGEVWVAAGTYYPTETTESTSSLYYKAFKIPAGITVRGGFNASSPEADKANRVMTADKNFGNGTKSESIDGETFKSGVYTNKTILCGDLTPGKEARLTWNATKQQFDVAFYGNSYHVVWFAMNGFDANGRANALAKPAKLEGCVIQGGHANNHDVQATHPHTAYGGGIYMVLNSFVYNCEVKNCDASRNGGGIYMDGGGIVRRTYVHDCQALGLGTDFGYGGGICQNGGKLTAKERPCVVAQSAVTNCVGRMGGGIAIMGDQTNNEGKYAVVSNSTLVNNCTATIEAGGVYTYKGGGVASLTIVKNKCNGSGITQNGTLTGQSGGLFSTDAAYVANTVIWGNECPANKNMQYANSRSNLNDNEKSKFYFNALSNADIADWSTVSRLNTISLETENSGTAKTSKGYALFKTPTTLAGYYDNYASGSFDWIVSSESSLVNAGINTADLDTDNLTPAPQGKSYDMQLDVFNARPTIGALIEEKGNVGPATNVAYNGDTYNCAFFVDPEFIYTENNTGSNGGNWTNPIRFLGNALDFIQEKINAGTYTSDTKVAIFVKQGTVDNTRNASEESRVRLTSLDIPSNVSVFGSFDSELTGTALTKRNVVHTPTVLSAQLMDSYKYNIAHMVNINGKQNITIDGFKISFANASSTELANTNRNGAAITIKNSSNLRFKNIIISNSTADKGAAVYADHSTGVAFENCIFHNNESKVLAESGIIYATNGSVLTFNHCDVLRNVGHASYLGSNNTKNNWKNSIFYGNKNQRLADTNSDMGGGVDKALAAFSGNTANAKGSYCMFDANSASFSGQFNGNDTGNQWQYNLQYAFVDGTGKGYPRFINPTKNSGVTEDGDATYYGRATSFEPHNNNPAVNMASHDGAHTTWGTDLVGITRDFGGLPDIGAVENHVATEGENAYKDGQRKYGEVLYVRDYNTYNSDGTVATQDLNTENRDGSSWARAINGNGDYSLSGTHTYKDTNLEAVMAYKINTGTSPNQYYLDVNNGTLNRVNSKTINVPVINPETGEPMTDLEENPITEPYNPADHCTVFILCDADGKDILFDSGKTPTAAKRLKDASTGEFLYLDYVKSNNTYTFRTSANPPAAQATATISGTSTYKISYKANGTTKYIGNANTIPGSTQTAWTFTSVSLSVDHGTGVEKHNVNYNMGTFKGLQYAVNKAHIAFKDDLSYSGDPATAKKQVWVGAGVYQRNPEINSTSNTTGFTTEHIVVDMDAENCFIIQNGVDVYGAFPKTGNPGMNEREALVSQYVHVQSERNITNVADYETILEPATKGISSNVKRRVLGQPYKYNPDKGNDTNRKGGASGTGILYCGIDYVNVVWDGFTLRDGVWDSQGLNRPNRYGGAGAAIYRNVTLKNAVVTNNTTIYSNAGVSQDIRAGGVYLDGGIVDACYVINNILEGWASTAKAHNGAAYGGGMYIYTGTIFNSVIANNQIFAKYSDGAGAFIENSNFFNNTIVNNKADGTSRASGGIAVWTDPGRGTESQLTLYNCIIAQNDGYTGQLLGDKNVSLPREGLIELNNCLTTNTTDKENTSKKSSIKFKNCGAAVTDYTDIFESGGQYGANFSTINLRLKPGASRAINQGNESPVIGGAVYNLIDYNDMDFAERIQDCNIDIGAYEFNGATNISPDITSVPGQAIYYVTPEGYGTTDAHDPLNAACAEKLQRVLDAAGRYKYLNPGKQVIVKVANSYDLLHPNNGSLAPSDELYVHPTDFKYYATRTTDWTDQDVRVWSIIVPRGVEVWGGYTDVASNNTHTSWSNSDNGFYERTGSEGSYVYTSRRNITKNPTYFDSYYLNKLEKTDANTYHVVSFTDRLFDRNGYAYTPQDFSSKSDDEVRAILEGGLPSTYIELLDNNESHFVHMTDHLGGLSGISSGNVINIGTAQNPKYASNRAVIDGIFVSGGKADAPSNSSATTLNINSYGGAALVNDYAYVRNCILTGNTATNGGALALTHDALVSGCLIVHNEASNQGGGIYVFEEGVKLSNGMTINTSAPDGQVTDYHMSHVLTSTIVANKAHQGGGIWFTNALNANARFNSVAVWQNEAIDQANVYGMVNPEQPTEDETPSEEFYPFSYSVIQNIRASGTNNQSAEPLNRQGMRFVKDVNDVGQTSVDQHVMAEEKNETNLKSKFADFGFYGLTNYSILCSMGMPKNLYDQLKASIAIADNDILDTDRESTFSAYIEVGARALHKTFPSKALMLRLFVAHPEDVDTQMAGRFMQLASKASPTDAEKYYSQEGSSFAYPFNSLQDALDYVKFARNNQLNIAGGSADAKDLPFEILVGKGEYYPIQDLNGNSKSVWSHTFAIPEGVTIVGGFNPQGGSGTYYGRYNKPKATLNTTTVNESSGQLAMSIYNNVELLPTVTSQKTPSATEIGRGNKHGTETVTLPKITGEDTDPVITFQQWDIQDICDRRAMADNNKNGIIEPWEFSNQTIISGNAVNGETDGVYHVMTAVADADAVGNLPTAGYRYDVSFPDAGAENGYKCWEYGQQIRLNGLIITGGNALTYLSTALDEYGKYIYYQGAGLQVDGNRYKVAIDAPSAPHTEPVFHNSAAYGVGYRDIPISVINCQFRNNIAGYGGAISTNGTLDTYATSFEQNLAIAQTETPEAGETWTTDVDPAHKGQTVNKVMYPGQGGAILATGQLSCYNTLFANNEARLGEGETETIDLVLHPTFRVPDENAASPTLRAAGGAIMIGSAGRYHMMNCDFVRNKANAYPVIFTMNPNSTEDEKGEHDITSTENYNQIVSTVVWGNEVNPDMLNKYKDNQYYQFASKMMVNVGKKRTDNTPYPAYNPSFAAGNVPLNQADLDQNWKEFVWFSAYEDGVGFTQNNTYDLRDHIIFKTGEFVNWNIKKAAKVVNPSVADGYFQNCNIQIVAKNDDVAGPNFGNPSVKAGFDGFMEGADWSPTRFNRLTDNGSGWIKQTVTKTDNDFVVTFNDKDTPGTGETTDNYYQGGYPVAHYKTYPEYKLWLAIGSEKYMQATNNTETDEIFINNTSLGYPQKNYPRISPDPTMGVTKAYIDIGVYEYQKQPLLKPGSEVDVLWVSTKEKPENGPADGSTWSRPTSDLQRAINTLLSSRNGHKKEIRIMEGEYSPVTPQMIGSTKYNAFVIDTKSLNEATITPTGFNDGNNNNQYYAQSLTIKGGYSQDIMYEYDPAQYKTIIRQNDVVSGVNTNYLVYINDPTLRYAYGTNEYTEANKYGATFGGDASAESHTARTMPIQVDGVTLINDAAAANTAGSAIYYPDVTGITESHSISVGGKVVYYPTKADLDANTNPVNYETEFALVTDEGAETITNPAKLVITKTEVMGSGKSGDGNSGSAVYIGQNGGSALIYNSVFHSNYGMPLNAYNTVSVNNTFGLNAGKVQLNGTSEMHNSVLWKNNGGGEQFSGATSFTYNSYTGCSPDANNNTALNNVNSNIVEGPNFVDPENAGIETRNFDIKPSVRLLNKGSETATAGTYYNKIMHYDLGSSKYAKYDYALISTTDVDVLNRPRFKNNIDIGAYEFQGELKKILFVDPNKSHNDAATGENWEKSFGYGDLQDAIDLAAVSHMLTPTAESYVFVKGASSTNKDLHTNETMTLRDGVTVYGGIPSDFTADIQKVGTDPTDTEIANYIRTVKEKREGPASPLSSKTTVNGIKIPADATLSAYATNGIATLVDGFVVTAGKTNEPVVDLRNSTTDAAIVVRNTIVAGNDLTEAPGVNAVEVSNGLIYEVLMRDNKVAANAAVLKVSSNGYVVSATVEGKTSGKGGDNCSDEHASHVFNSIVNCINPTGNALGSDLAFVDNKEISGHFYNMHDANLNYQLTETSDYIDDATLSGNNGYDCKQTDTHNCHNPKHFLPANLQPFVNYMTDRDLLGVPRVLAGISDHWSLDRGAFETWKVEENFHTGKNGTISKISPYKENIAKVDAERDKDLENIATKFYPHYGNVVYVMEGKFATADAPGAGYDDTNSYPGLILLKDGASFYANGRALTCPYVIIERKVKRDGSVVALPYNMNYVTGVSRPYYTKDSNNKDKLNEQHSGITNGVYTYNGVKRSDWQHIFHNVGTGNDCWTSLADDQTVEACKGVFFSAVENVFNKDKYNVNGAQTEVTLRFAAKGTAINDYVYTENPTSGPYVQKKTVTLTQNDDSQSTNNGADFTDAEDMGWNLIGLPWLVSDYKTYTTTVSDVSKHGVADNYMMQNPFVMWLYYDGVNAPDGTTVNGDGGYYSVKSWSGTDDDWHVVADAKKSIWVGEGIFVQTAATTDTETLTFYRPLSPGMDATTGHAKSGSNNRYYVDMTNGIETAEQLSGDAELIATEYYTVGGVRINKAERGSVTLVRKIYSNGVVKTQKVYIK